MLPFPRIPTIETNHALGAVALNSYHKGVRFCLGRSHEPTALQQAVVTSTTSTDWRHVQTWFLPYRGDRLSYHYILSTAVNAAAIGYLELRYLGDDAAEHVVISDDVDSGDGYSKSVTGTKTAVTHYGTQMTAGNVYEWRLYLKANNGSYTCSISFWELNHYTNAVAGWTAPPTLVADAVSAAADLNKFKTDLDALNTYRLGVAKALTGCPAIVYTSGSTSWITAGSFVYRYRPDRLRVNVWCQSVVGAAYGWDWCVTAQEWGGAESAALYSSPSPIVQTDNNGKWGTEQGIDMSGAGFHLGDWVLIRIKVKGTAVTNLQAVRYVCQRYSTGAAAAGWEALTDWAEGDSDIGPTNLNKITTDLTALYASGAEELWGYIQACGGAGPGISGNMLNQYRHTGPHLKRWLHYKKGTNQSPQVLFGPNLTRTASLNTNSGWQVYDLDATEIAPGSTYEVTGCEGAFEYDSAAL